ncbi:hypothetical protein ACFPYI_14555 [Halomarina salina]|uniref:Uncharacterized protein n=1 Tax=Halomarina salina TaxID=1872699 RepID=A0ABD5RPY1_9EURY|nr:hypothetical protein [Halomarina salina]
MVPLQAVGTLFVAVFLALAVLAPLVLYSLVRSEHDGRTTMSREEGERAARRDSRDDFR